MSVKASFVKSSAWMALGAAFNNISSTLVFIVLARLLAPEQFGIVAFAAIFIDVARVASSGGMVDILVERPEWNETTAASAFWASLGFGLLASLLLGGFAAPLAYRFYDPLFGLVLAALAPLPIIDALATVPMARLKRDFRYRAIAARGSAMSLLGGLVGIGLALAGMGVWALVISKLVGVALATMIIWASAGWSPAARPKRAALRAILPPSLHLLGSQLMAQLNTQAVGLLIGAFLGPAALAHFRVGARLFTLLASLLITPLQSAAISLFSRLDDRAAQIGPAYLRLTRACSLVAAPAYLGVAALGPDLVALLFGPQWGLAGHVVSLTGLTVGAAILIYFLAPALTAAGRPDMVLKTWSAALAGNIAMAAAMLPFGLVAVAGGQALRPYLTLPLALAMLKRQVGIRPGAILAALAPTIGAGMTMAAIITLLRIGPLAQIGPLARLLMLAPLGALAYLALVALFDRRLLGQALRDLHPLLPSRLFKKKRSVLE